ncbi:hypothetical protein FLO80_09975 [Aquicoccus porphyridii]|uniref:Chemotaxis protein CheA n=1 Tax=Aquicoccus porphyridii TaxID=1852029 RepID=A0A5A9ZFR1_9RHOB|nr:hypothetical protein [Aquicoccus porphyridii]KAA0916051.1 hypothetical protein FLO80_09975 [Aquicoccus porphyridii]RAI52692.1 hypothetical protein DOO74_16185 [Rhodobacteraceae bacterium AsT-22]
MVNTNKILTVSYGTFSCTLEGFDDSFGTMKAIAEYFRDLASDDRYFGAEPPTPDAEMLARIAEREIERRVDAHFDQNRIVLRAGPGSTLTAAAAADPEAEKDEITDDATENLTPRDNDQTRPEQPSEPRETEQLAEAPTAPEAIEAAPNTPDSAAKDPVGHKADDASPQEGESATQLDAPIHAPIPAAGPEPESVAAKLQRIRAVVSQAETADTPTAAYSEDEHADDLLSEAHDDIEAAMDIDDETEMRRSDFDDSDEDTSNENDTISSLLARFDTPDDDDEDLFDETEDEALTFDIGDDEIEADQPASDTPPVRARVIKMKRAEFEAAIADGKIEDDDAAADTEAETDLSPEDEADLLRELAAVEAELTISTDDGHGDTAADDDEDNRSSLIDESEDDEFDEDETGEDSINFFADEEDDTTDRTTPFAGSDAESEMGRIFKETDVHLNEETGRGRRNAIAHLRAAVEANKAEIGAGGDLAGEGPDSEAYRDDLASVVRPRRPQAHDQADRSRRPGTARPAPLKLVAEQRVDLGDAEPAPVRPRRVQVATATHAEIAAATSDFAEYADTVGATSLPELLEAAAAYLSFVEGREQFSRPQLMTHVRQAEKNDFSREDGLRSFGQLLREGKIVKLKGGRFTASDSISYRPDARYAGE